MITKIISGGQTGADRAALDFAIDKDILHGGWIPKGRIAEDGPISDRYHLTEMATNSYRKRTEQNVIDSDGTLIFSHGILYGGSKYTMEMVTMHGKPFLHVDLETTSKFGAAQQITKWIEDDQIDVLNVAGPRDSEDPSIYREVRALLNTVYHLAVAEKDVVAMYGHGMPKTVESAVERLSVNMPLKAKADLARQSEGDLMKLHFTYGSFLRNQFGLWANNIDLLDDCRKVSGKTVMPPEEASLVIIRELWKRLKKTHRMRVIK